jgi:transcriptional regulator with XRE-family HTH domain
MNHHNAEGRTRRMLRLKILRLNAGRSQWEISRGLMSQGRYSMIERGLISPTPEERRALATTLSAPASSLFRRVTSSKAKTPDINRGTDH